jgi:Flp pilus assembly pilin Flp
VNTAQRIDERRSRPEMAPYDPAMTDTTQPNLDPETETPQRRAGERGQGMIEYAFILILIAITLLIALQTLGHQTSNLFSNIGDAVGSAAGSH